MSDCTPFYVPGNQVTCNATAAVVGKTFVKIAASRPLPALNNTTDFSGLVQAITATAGSWGFGVAAYDAASGAFTVFRGSGYIVPVTASGAITAGDALDIATGGKVSTHTSGVIVGYALGTAADGTDCQVALV